VVAIITSHVSRREPTGQYRWNLRADFACRFANGTLLLAIAALAGGHAGRPWRAAGPLGVFRWPALPQRGRKRARNEGGCSGFSAVPL
jgi:hypothetical protein